MSYPETVLYHNASPEKEAKKIYVCPKILMVEVPDLLKIS